jgi:hypothetical protein
VSIILCIIIEIQCAVIITAGRISWETIHHKAVLDCSGCYVSWLLL